MSGQALSGFRVLDMADEMGVYGAKLLADLGADVVRVEPPGGDSTRRRGPFFKDDPTPERSLYFMAMNTNKRGVTLNLETRAGQDLFKKLVKTADVVYETFPVGYMASLGLGYKDLKSINPKLVVTSVTPFGQTGPYRNWKTTDLVSWMASGHGYLVGLPDRPPLNVPDVAFTYSGYSGAIGTLSALWARDKIGVGQQVDVPVHESLVSITTESGPAKYLEDILILKRGGRKRSGMGSIGLYPCKDGAVCVCLQRPTEWDNFAKWAYEITGDDMILSDMFKGNAAMRYRYDEVVDMMIEAMTTQLTKKELFDEARRRDCSITPVNTLADLLEDDHLRARSFWVEADHPETGTLTYPGAPYILSESPWSLRRPAPRIGQHNDEVFVGELGLSREDMAALAASGAI